jgi:clan AA aspartic protease
MTGFVNAERQPVIQVLVRGPSGLEQEVEAVVDTGFDQALTLPFSLIAALGLVLAARGQVNLADGSTEEFDIYLGTVLLDGRPLDIEIEAVEVPPLVGMSLLDGYDVHIQAIIGGRVTIERLP